MAYLAKRDKRDVKIERQDDEDEDSGEVTFDQTPVRVQCPHCGLSIITFIEHESSWVTYAVAIVLLLVLNWAALCVVPVVYPLFKDVVHHCPRCLSVLATRSRVAIAGFKAEVMSFRFGSCVIVLARKYVLMLLALTTLIAGIHFMRSSTAPISGIDAFLRGEPQTRGWDDFVKDCGFKSYLGNPIHVKMAFNENYKNQTFRWNGSVHHVEVGLSLLWWSQRGAVFVRMDPAQFPAKQNMADLVLLYNDNDKQVTDQVVKLKRGQTFAFEGTMVEVGKRGAPHVMSLWELQPNALPTNADAKEKLVLKKGFGEASEKAVLVEPAGNSTAGGTGGSEP